MAALFYQMLTGKFIRDFEALDALVPQAAVLKRKLVPIRDRDASIPAALAEVIDSVLREEDNEDDDDFTSAKMFGKKIRQALNMR